MTDRVYPTAAKPAPPPGAMAMNGNGNGNGAQNGAGVGPAKTGQLYNPNRPRPGYRPQQPPRRRGRSCSCRRFCCLCFLYTLIFLLTLLLLAAIGACIFYVLYHPKHPTFSLSSVRTTRLNLTGPDPSGFSHLATGFDLVVTARNPNKKNIVFLYDPMSVALSASGVDAGNATLPGFSHAPGNTTVIKSAAVGDPRADLDSDSVAPLRSALGKKSGVPVSVEIDTKVEVRMGKLKSRKVGIRVSCDGIRAFPPKNATSKVGTPAITSNAKCKVDLRIKIWKFTF